MLRKLPESSPGVLYASLLLLCWCVLPAAADTDPCTLSGQSNIDQCAWNTFASFLSGNTWASWSSTADLLDQQTPGPSGSRFIPPACATLHSQNPSLRVIDQVGKVNDSVFEAGDTGSTRTYTWTGSGERSNGVGLSGDPVVAANGTFLRYEILINPTEYDWVVANGLYKASTLESWNGDLIFPDGSITIKNAWMELGDLPADQFHTEDLLIYTPGSLLESSDDACEKKTMALVGQHLATKTSANPGWTWATFEHVYAAPDCTGSMPDANTGGTNTTCPDSSTKSSQLSGSTFSSYLLNPTQCSGGCAGCNTKPSYNCQPGSTGADTSYCVDASPNSSAGTSQLCRQVAPSVYRDAAGENQSTLSNSQYLLIATQWFPNGGSGDINNAPTVRLQSNRDGIKPASVPDSAGGTLTKSVLGNTTMESYERSNCMGCHSSSVFKQSSGTQISTDYMYWMTIEVPCGANGDPTVCPTGAPAPVPASQPKMKRSSTSPK